MYFILNWYLKSGSGDGGTKYFVQCRTIITFALRSLPYFPHSFMLQKSSILFLFL